MSQVFRTDLHVHTVLSPCAALEMIPPLIVETALERGIQLIAITDHNSSSNVQAVLAAAEHTQLTIIPGMEVQTIEEVHMLCLFADLAALANWQTIVDANLPALNNNPDYFGSQLVVDATGDFLRFEPRLLLQSVRLSLEQCVEIIHSLDGIAIPAHVNRQANGLFANLGMIPAETAFDGMEISRHMTPQYARQKYAQLNQYTLIQSGDVHHLPDFLGSSYLTLEAPTLAEIRQAFMGENGRRIEII